MAPPSGISIKSIGLIAAGVLALIFISIIGISMMLSKPPAQNTSNLFPENPDEIIDIEDTQSGGAMLVTMVDQDDPTRIASTLRADRFEPIGEGRRRLDKPESWIFLEDGRAIRVNADFATMLMPDPNQPPESGTLEGNIVLRAYDTIPAPGTPAPDDQAPTLTARFDQPVEFERRYLRMRSAGRFEIQSEQIDFFGTDLTVIMNNLRNRIELVDVGQGDKIVIHTNAVQSTPDSTSETTDSSNNTSTKTPNSTPTRVADAQPINDQPAVTTPSEPNIQRYNITLDRDVTASVSGSASINADTLQIWATLIDGQLPEDAVRSIAIAESEAIPSPSTPDQTSPRRQTSDITASSTSTSTPSTTSDDLVITWSGPMRVRPIDDEIPSQLINDHLALRLDSDDASGIEINAPERGFTGQAKQLTYFATRAVADFVGEETEKGVLKMQVDKGGTLFASALSADLATGRISMKRRGSITTLSDEPDQAASVRWTKEALIEFAIDENGAITQRLRHARFEGAAIAEQDGNSIGARVIDATLNPDLPPVSALTKLTLTEGVISSAEHSMLSGRDLTIDFETSSEPGSTPYPVKLSSIGSAMGRTPDAMLRAEEMHADMYRDATGSTQIRTARAKGDVLYRDRNRTTANTQNLDANMQQEIIILKGPESSVTQGGSTIAGEHITLQAKRRSIEVQGAGEFDHDIALAENENAQPGQLGHINARWTESMRFDDTLGKIVCNGEVRMISTPDAFTRDTLKANEVTISLTPMPSSDPVAGGQDRQRELLSARASGRAEPGNAPLPASIESRTYSPNDPQLATGVLYLEGAQILADNQKQTLSVPGEGTLLILDRERDAHATEDSQSPDGSGLTRFTWESRMLLERAQGLGTFAGGVLVDHKSLISNKVSTLSTDSLIARFDSDQASPDESTDPSSINAGITLRSATATGNVRFLFEGSELLCDKAVYDAIEESLFASALEDTLVTLYDNKQPAPVSAKTIRWDLDKDQVELNAPSPIRTTPGG